jgi:hypothetical protein
MSLKRDLEHRIREYQELTYDDMVILCRIRGRKIGNGERSKTCNIF